MKFTLSCSFVAKGGGGTRSGCTCHPLASREKWREKLIVSAAVGDNQPARLQHGGKSAEERHDIGNKPEVSSHDLVQVSFPTAGGRRNQVGAGSGPRRGPGREVSVAASLGLTLGKTQD